MIPLLPFCRIYVYAYLCFVGLDPAPFVDASHFVEYWSYTQLLLTAPLLVIAPDYVVIYKF